MSLQTISMSSPAIVDCRTLVFLTHSWKYKCANECWQFVRTLAQETAYFTYMCVLDWLLEKQHITPRQLTVVSRFLLWWKCATRAYGSQLVLPGYQLSWWLSNALCLIKYGLQCTCTHVVLELWLPRWLLQDSRLFWRQTCSLLYNLKVTTAIDSRIR